MIYNVTTAGVQYIVTTDDLQCNYKWFTV